MPPPEHLHIITAGTDIFPAYVRALRDHDDITETIVVADDHYYSVSTREEKPVQVTRERTRNAVAKVRAHAAALKIPVSFVFITLPVLETARDALFRILEEHPGARLTFDLSGGPKDLCMALFHLSLWVEAKTHYTLPGPGGREERAEFGVPGIPVATIAANWNYLRVLEALSRQPENFVNYVWLDIGGQELKVGGNFFFPASYCWQGGLVLDLAAGTHPFRLRPSVQKKEVLDDFSLAAFRFSDNLHAPLEPQAADEVVPRA